MRIWNAEGKEAGVQEGIPVPETLPRYALVDAEVGIKDRKVHDIGAIRDDGAVYHGASKEELFGFLAGMRYVCGHNIVHYDAPHLFLVGNALGSWLTRFIFPPCCSPNGLITAW